MLFCASYCWWWRSINSRYTKTFVGGADKVSINTAAIKNPDLIKESANKFGSQCIVVAIDAKKTKTILGRYLHMGVVSQPS